MGFGFHGIRKLGNLASRWIFAVLLLCIAGLFVGGVGSCVVAYYGPSAQREDRVPPIENARLEVERARRDTEVEVARLMPDARPRLEGVGNSLDIYLTNHEFESVPFPDRRETVRRIGTAWCARVDHFELPVVQLRDIKTGHVFGSYSCLLGWVSSE